MVALEDGGELEQRVAVAEAVAKDAVAEAAAKDVGGVAKVAAAKDDDEAAKDAPPQYPGLSDSLADFFRS